MSKAKIFREGVAGAAKFIYGEMSAAAKASARALDPRHAEDVLGYIGRTSFLPIQHIGRMVAAPFKGAARASQFLTGRSAISNLTAAVGRAGTETFEAGVRVGKHVFPGAAKRVGKGAVFAGYAGVRTAQTVSNIHQRIGTAKAVGLVMGIGAGVGAVATLVDEVMPADARSPEAEAEVMRAATKGGGIQYGAYGQQSASATMAFMRRSQKRRMHGNSLGAGNAALAAHYRRS